MASGTDCEQGIDLLMTQTSGRSGLFILLDDMASHGEGYRQSQQDQQNQD